MADTDTEDVSSPLYAGPYPDVDTANDFQRVVLFLHHNGFHRESQLSLFLVTAPLAVFPLLSGCCLYYAGLCLLFDFLHGLLASWQGRAEGPGCTGFERAEFVKDSSEGENDLDKNANEDALQTESERGCHGRPQASTAEQERLWNRLQGGLPVEVDNKEHLQERNEIVFCGAICAAFYVAGVMAFLHDRFGKAQFREKKIAFSGASSGGHLSGYAGAPAIYSDYSQQRWALTQMAFPFRLFGLLPLGILFCYPLGIRESGMWGLRTVWRVQSQHAAHEGGDQIQNGSPAAGICWNDLSAGASMYRMWHTKIKLEWTSCLPSLRLWRCVSAFANDNQAAFGDQCVSTGFIPLVMCPALCFFSRWKQHIGRGNFPLLDGFLYAPYLMEPPVLEDPRVTPGRRLVFSLFPPKPRDRAAWENTVFVNLGSWGSLHVWRDILLRLGWFGGSEDPERLFEKGKVDAAQNVEELDAALMEAFDMVPYL